MNTAARSVLLTIVLVAVWFAAGREFWRISTHSRQVRGAVSEHSTSQFHTDSVVTEALKPATMIVAPKFDNTLDSPFGSTGAGGQQAAVSTPARPRVELRLNGLLLKSDKPQAILEDPQGGTHICGAGDTVLGQIVVRIERDQVVLRDQGGTYYARVRE